MTIDQAITDTEVAPQPFDSATAQAFAGRFIGILNDAAIAMLTSVGHQTQLFETLAGLPAATSEQIADAADLNERYVREWLGGMTAAGVVIYDSSTATFRLPQEHAASLTSAAGPNNLALLMQHIAMMGDVEQSIVERFRHGGGLAYADYPTFHRNMAQTSAAVHDAALIDGILPLAPRLPESLRSGISVADIGCGQGHAVNLMAQAFPASRFVGYDFIEDGIVAARAEAAAMGLQNVRFETLDVTHFDVVEGFDAITAFDAIHDQARPSVVLRNIYRALKPGGTFLMVDIRASSHLEDNVALPWGSYLYAISMFHCMSVSLGLDGDGLGTAWGTQRALTMLGEAGFHDVDPRGVDSDPFNTYFVARK